MNYTPSDTVHPPQQEHRLTLENRQHLSLSGVTEVDSFDDTTVALRTVQGTLVVSGDHLKLKSLAPGGGDARVDGNIVSLHYEAAAPEGGWLKRLFG